MLTRQHYHDSVRRLILLDYDGTLVEFASTPEAATPTPAALALLGALTADVRNTVVIVSGRDQATLDTWLGHLPLALAAEHGLFIKPHQGAAWRPTLNTNPSWKVPVRALMSRVAVPESFIEEKAMALVWHYRKADSHQAAHAAVDLLEQLEPLANLHGLRVMPGHRVIEVLPAGAGKGQAAKHWLEAGDYDFILAAGDDTTDEDLFRALPPYAHTIKVGPPSRHARGSVPDPAALIRRLTGLL